MMFFSGCMYILLFIKNFRCFFTSVEVILFFSSVFSVQPIDSGVSKNVNQVLKNVQNRKKIVHVCAISFSMDSKELTFLTPFFLTFYCQPGRKDVSDSLKNVLKEFDLTILDGSCLEKKRG